MTDSELISQVYDRLSDGIPVPVEWAAQLDGEWTLHYSLITGIDIPGDKITVVNPYGYVEELLLSDFLKRTSFEAYEGMPIFLKLGFAFGLFEENAIFTIQRVGQ